MRLSQTARGEGGVTMLLRSSVHRSGMQACAVAVLLTSAAWAYELESEALRLRVDQAGVVSVHDKRTGITWQQATPRSEGGWPKGGPIIGGPMPVVQVPAWKLPTITSAEKSGDEIRVHAQWQIPLTYRWRLDGPDRVCMTIDSPAPAKTLKRDNCYWGAMLVCPPPFYADHGARFAVMPFDEGVIFPTAETDFDADHVRFGTKSIGKQTSMPWWGVTDCARGVMTVVETPFHGAVKTMACETPDGERALPVAIWLASRGSFGYPRRLTFHFVSEGGYAAMAKRFRRQLLSANQFRTLQEKARHVPAVAKLKGAMDMWVFMKDPMTVADIEKIHGFGFDRLLLQVFAHTQPAPEQAFTREAVATARRLGYLTGQYHLYSWVYKRLLERDPSLKQMCIKEREGYRFIKGFWPEHLLFCPGVLGDVFSPVLKEERAFGLGTFFTDTTTAGGSVRDCYDEAHPLTKPEAAEAICKALSSVTDKGLVVGSEKGFWWAAADCDYFEGVGTLIEYFGKFIGPTVPLRHSGPFRTDLQGYKAYMVDVNYGPQNRVPLFQLVFHDSVYCTRRWNDHHTRDLDLWRMNDLMNISYGTPPIVCFHQEAGPHILRDDWEPYRERYLRTYRDVCGWHEQIGFDEMIDHKFLTDDRLVQEPRFSSGKGVVVNFGEKPWQDPKRFTVPPRDWRTFEFKSKQK